jgi:hypothetical protein
VIINTIKSQRPALLDKLYKLCYDSGKWKKWVSEDFDPLKNKVKIIEISGHYVFATQGFQEIKDQLVDVDAFIKKELNQKLMRWLGLN